MYLQPIETGRNLLDHVQLIEGVLDSRLVTVVHLVEFGNNVIIGWHYNGILSTQPRTLL